MPKAARSRMEYDAGKDTSSLGSRTQSNLTGSAFRLDVISSGLKKEIDQRLQQALIHCNLPFSIVKNPEFQALFDIYLRPTYHLPSRRTVSGPMLLQAYHDMLNKVRIRLADYSKYLTLSCDGWSRTQGKEHLLGFTACDPSSGMVVFLDFVSNADSERCNGQFTLEKTLEIAMKHSMLSNKVSFVVTDTASVMKSYWSLLMFCAWE
ncbi:hypothetical protein CEUSTIGMA_g7316.t1 [Chlamydomonas eustigma]|uniref:DUF659 domain-containing protein n=1 Tax=Chlamydomonas eustigma TaxID=1157962 RepID=A0A250XA06_9CHLO|nr:hypothetical protein CEUSTIGMA_g7316.t1 [Chlamydomonas eustigma]|eukprot:GAX79876.1 hypothetical protein CEUSTIGMA_g7316.t1 [Chlamydomonas eustigma]